MNVTSTGSRLPTQSSLLVAREPHAAEPGAPADSLELTGAPPAIASSRTPAEESEPPRLRDLLRLAVGSHMAALPAQVAVALQACEAASEATARKELDDPSVQRGIAALRGLAELVEPGVLAEVGLDAEVADSRRFLEGFLLPADNPPHLAARGQAILDRLEQASPAPLHARAVVLDGPSLVAFARGGENLYVGQETLDLPEDEAAAIMGHERAHLLERHLTKAQICSDVARHLSAMASPSPALAASLKVLGTLAQAATQREQEFVADAMAARVLAQAGYDPSAMGRVVKRLQGDEPEQPSPLDDHPPLAARLAALERV